MSVLHTNPKFTTLSCTKYSTRSDEDTILIYRATLCSNNLISIELSCTKYSTQQVVSSRKGDTKVQISFFRCRLTRFEANVTVLNHGLISLFVAKLLQGVPSTFSFCIHFQACSLGCPYATNFSLIWIIKEFFQRANETRIQCHQQKCCAIHYEILYNLKAMK